METRQDRGAKRMETRQEKEVKYRWLGKPRDFAGVQNRVIDVFTRHGWKPDTEARSIIVHDRYLDTDDWRILRSQAVLRLREAPTGTSLELKGTAPSVDGFSRRREWELPYHGDIPEDVTPQTVFRVDRKTAGALGDAVTRFLQGKPLTERVSIHQERDVVSCNPGGTLYFDTVRVRNAELLYFLEIELPEGTIETTGELETYRQLLSCFPHFEPDSVSKFETAVKTRARSGGLKLPATMDLPDIFEVVSGL
jgi:hypothetical protein